MKINEHITCANFPCTDVRHDRYVIPGVDVDPTGVSIVLISESAPAELVDHYDAGEEALFARTTVLAFQDAGANVASIQDVRGLGVYLTTAVKCGFRGRRAFPSYLQAGPSFGIEKSKRQMIAQDIAAALALVR